MKPMCDEIGGCCDTIHQGIWMRFSSLLSSAVLDYYFYLENFGVWSEEAGYWESQLLWFFPERLRSAMSQLEVR